MVIRNKPLKLFTLCYIARIYLYLPSLGSLECYEPSVINNPLITVKRQLMTSN